MRLKLKPVYESGNRKSWFKAIESVDMAIKTGYCFKGDFLPGNKEIELNPGQVIIECVPGGSVKHPTKTGRIWKVTADPEDSLEMLDDGYNWKTDFLSFRDAVASKLNLSKPNPLAQVSTSDLILELRNRNVTLDLSTPPPQGRAGNYRPYYEGT